MPEFCAARLAACCARLLGSTGFVDFKVGSNYSGCYRYDVAVNLMSGWLCQTQRARWQNELLDHVHDQL